MEMRKKTFVLAAVLSVSAIAGNAGAEEVMTLQQCRDSAIANNFNLKIARKQMEMAEHDRKTAMANYFPDISVSGAYMYNSRSIDLLSQETSEALSGMGTSAQEKLLSRLDGLLSDTMLGQILKNNPELLRMIGKMGTDDIAGSLNAIGSEISDALELDTRNMFIGAVSLKQPVFMGGKIVNANKIAVLAEELAASVYDTGYSQAVSEVDNAYWQIVSISGKRRLAMDYAELLRQMLHDTEILEAEGIATQSDLLSVKVKANEAEMMLTKAENGLVIGKMLLCQLCGMDPGSDIRLADEITDDIPLPEMGARKDMEDILAARPEIRSLEIAEEIYHKKIAVARADMMPQVALTANYLISNPNVFNGFRNDFAGMFNVGVAVNIPIVHGCEARQKVRKARAEAVIAGYRLEDAKEKITLQVARLRQQQDEALEKVGMTERNLESAEENLRAANAGYMEGVVPASTVMAAQTAWMQAHSGYIDAKVELQMTAGALAAAERR